MALADVMHKVGPNLWQWFAPHPDWSAWDPAKKTGFGWTQEVGCICLETATELVLIDPLAPPTSTQAHREFWQALDDEVQRKQQPVTILLSTDWHDRSAQDVYDRYVPTFGASIRVPKAVPRGSLNCRPTHFFREGVSLAGGVEAFFIEAPHPEVAFYIPFAEALVVADALWGTPDGRIWLGSHEVCTLLPRLLKKLPIRRLLLSHGVSILSDAHTVLARIVAERPELNGEPSPHS